MNKKFIFPVLLILTVIGIVGLKQNNSTASGDSKKKEKSKIQWTTIDKGLELAKKQNKMLVVDIYTDWCHWCKVMEKETYSDKNVVKYAKEKLIMAKLNAESEKKYKFHDRYFTGKELALLFGVTGFPTTLFFNAKGELITKVAGYIPADTFNLILTYLDENWYEKMEFDEYIQKHAQKDKG